MSASLKEAVLLQLDLDWKDRNGVSKRSRLEKIWEQTGKKPAELQDPDIPESGYDLYLFFWDMYNHDGISWGDFYYYSMYKNIWFTGEEIKIIRDMDVEARAWIQKKQNAEMSKK